MNPYHHPSDNTTAPAYRYTSAAYIVVTALLLTLLLASCSSTSIDGPATPAPAEENDLVVTIAPGDNYSFPGTRADNDHAGHQLRYTAWLYQSVDNSSTNIVPDSEGKPAKNLVRRVEQLASDGNKVIFRNVKDAGFYFIMVFADYIDAGATLDTDGYYPDKYYDTHSKCDVLSLKASGAQIFNNHNLDCFLYVPTYTFKKETSKPYDMDCQLKRMVSRIQVIANAEGRRAALKDIEVTQYSVMDELSYSAKYATKIVTKKEQVTIQPAESSSDQNQIFFYYTLNAATGKALAATNFKLNPNPGYEFAQGGEYAIPDGKIVPDPNIIYKVTGNFLTTTLEPATAVDLKVTVNSNWGEASQQIPDQTK